MRISKLRSTSLTRSVLPRRFHSRSAAASTPAASATSQVPDDVKNDRLARLQDVLAQQQLAFNRAWYRPHIASIVRQTGPLSGPAGRPQPLFAERSSDGREHHYRRHRPGDDLLGKSEQSLGGAREMTALRSESAAGELPDGRTQLEFDDNLLLPSLYGERDQHLDRVERQLGISLITRGNRLVISGPPSATEAASLALSRLYDRLSRVRILILRSSRRP